MGIIDEFKKMFQPSDGLYNRVVQELAELRSLELDIEIIRVKLKKLKPGDEIDEKIKEELIKTLADKEKKAESIKNTLSSIRKLLEKEGL